MGGDGGLDVALAECPVEFHEAGVGWDESFGTPEDMRVAVEQLDDFPDVLLFVKKARCGKERIVATRGELAVEF